MPDTSTHTDYAETYAAYAQELTHFVHQRVDEADAADLLQEVWSAYATNYEEAVITQPRAWLYRVARNRITDLARLRSRRPAFVALTPALEFTVDEASYPGELEDIRAELDTALTLLPPKQREVFVRNELGGETLRQIAEDLGVPLKTVISRKGYARQRLRDLLRDTYEDY
jgi:RNA polymerase sigma factor (sigma-70 family)